ncbi:MAG: hypothetical protein N2C12_08500 [Planctomycetales bacterium]|jgi:hypothetical protein
MSLDNLRQQLGRTWIIVLFGFAYLISQVTIIIILGPIEHAMLKLQLTGISVADYVSVFSAWEASGDMAYYRAHFILDDVHWIWYSVLFTAVLCRLFDCLEIPSSRNWFLLLPLASGLLDWYENRLQHVFLSSADLTTIIDPLPLYSTLASDIKWLLALLYMGASMVLVARYLISRRNLV